MSASAMKIFGLGLSRTGTASLGRALELLGFRTCHYPHDRQTLAELTAGQYRLSVLERADALLDITAAPFYPQFDAAYPGSRFILTVRDKQHWLRSVRDHFQRLARWGGGDETFDDMTRFLCACAYGTWGFNEHRFDYVYDLHMRNVQAYFRTRANDLLVIDICGGDGWATLCPFLGVPVPDEAFPHTNQAPRVAGTRRAEGRCG